MPSMKKYQLFNLLSAISMFVAISLSIIWGNCTPDMMQETLLGIGVVTHLCASVVMCITAYRIKEGL